MMVYHKRFDPKHEDWTAETPRFLNVRVRCVYKSMAAAEEDGFTEPTHYRDEEYHIRGKSLGNNMMVFCAVERWAE